MRATTPKPIWRSARIMLSCYVLVVMLTAGGLLLAQESRLDVDSAREKVLGVAQTVAVLPQIVTGLATPAPAAGAGTSALQPFVERLRQRSEVDFIVVMNRAGIRYTHPTTTEIGKRYLGTIAPAVGGRTYSEEFDGTLGRSERTITPVVRDGRVIGMVSVGITLRHIGGNLLRHVGLIAALAAVLLAVGLIGTWLVGHAMRRKTRGLSTQDLERMTDYYSSTLHALREGLLLVDTQGRVSLCNDAARELLGAGDEPITRVGDLAVPVELQRAMTDPETRSDEIHLTHDRVVVLTTTSIESADQRRGIAVTLRDHTEVLAASDELSSVRRLADGLRAQAHESANRLHTVVSLVEMGRSREAIALATADTRRAQQLSDRLVHEVGEPVVAALLLAKSAEANERGVDLVVTDDTVWSGYDGVDQADLVTVLGNLVDNAVDAAVGNQAVATPTVAVTVRANPAELVVIVADTGAGIDLASTTRVLDRGWSTKTPHGQRGHGLGLALVAQVVRRHDGRVDVSNGTGMLGGAVFSVRIPAPQVATCSTS